MKKKHFLVGFIILIISLLVPFMKSSPIPIESETEEIGMISYINSYLKQISYLKEYPEITNRFTDSIKSFIENLNKVINLDAIVFVLGGTCGATIMTFEVYRIKRAIFYVFKKLPKKREVGVHGADKILEEERSYIYEISLKLADTQTNQETILEKLKQVEEEYNKNQMNPLKYYNRINSFLEWIALYLNEQEINSTRKNSGTSEKEITDVICSNKEMVRREANEDIEVLEFVEQLSPAFGVAGTVIGLSLLLSQENINDFNTLLQPMSIALLTTLYGILLGQTVVAPAVSKRINLREATDLSYQMIQDAMLALKRGAYKTDISELLLGYLSPSAQEEQRNKILEEIEIENWSKN